MSQPEIIRPQLHFVTGYTNRSYRSIDDKARYEQACRYRAGQGFEAMVRLSKEEYTLLDEYVWKEGMSGYCRLKQFARNVQEAKQNVHTLLATHGIAPPDSHIRSDALIIHHFQEIPPCVVYQYGVWNIRNYACDWRSSRWISQALQGEPYRKWYEDQPNWHYLFQDWDDEQIENIEAEYAAIADQKFTTRKAVKECLQDWLGAIADDLVEESRAVVCH